MSLVKLEMPYFPDPTIGRPVYYGSIYIGEPDTDPALEVNQKSVLLKQENGVSVPTTQPVLTGAGGVPLYNGSPVQLIVDGDYSLKILNKQGAQVYYVPSAVAVSDLLASGYLVIEEQTLASGQVEVTFSSNLTYASFYLGGDDVDRGRLVEDLDYTVDLGTSIVTLTNSYPAGSKLTAAYNEVGSGFSFVNYYDTLADLRGAVTALGTVAYMKGYSSAGDGGAGEFLWDSSDLTTEVAVDTQSGIYVAPSSDLTGASGAWVRQYSGAVNIKWFGANEIRIDNDIPINAALALQPSEVFIPSGTFITAGPIVIDYNAHIFGSIARRPSVDAPGSHINNQGTGNCITLAATTNLYDGGIDNLTLTSLSGHTIEAVQSIIRFRMISLNLNVVALNKSCLEINNSISSAFKNGTYSCTVGGRTAPLINLHSPTNTINGNSFDGMWLNNSSNVHAVWLNIESSGTYLYNNTFKHITCENCTGGFISMSGTIRTVINNLSMWDAVAGYDNNIINIDSSTSVYRNLGLSIDGYIRAGDVLNAGINDIYLGYSSTTIIKGFSPTNTSSIDFNNKNCVLIGSSSTNDQNDTQLTIYGGLGVKFSATPLASTDPHTLDDYVELDDFVPVIASTSNCSNVLMTNFRVTKIGRLVNINFNGTLTITAINTLTGFSFTIPYKQAINSDALAGTAWHSGSTSGNGVGFIQDNTSSTGDAAYLSLSAMGVTVAGASKTFNGSLTYITET